MPVFSARASTSVPTPHTTRHTHPSPSLAKLPSTVTSTTLPAPSHVLRTLHHAPGPGVDVGWAISLCGAMVLVLTTVLRCICAYTYCTGWTGPESPPFASDTTAATRITAWPRRQPHQGRERFRSSRWQYRDRALDHTTAGMCVHVLVLLYAPALTLAPCDGGPGRAEHHTPMPILTARWQMADAGVSCKKGPPSSGKQHVVTLKDRHGLRLKRYSTVPPSRSRSHNRARIGAGTFAPLCTPFCVPLPAETMTPQHLSIRGRSTGHDKAGQSDSRTVGDTYRRLGPRRPKQCPRA